MEIAALVYVLETLEYLICDHEDCLKWELSVTYLKKILKWLPQAVHHHRCVFLGVLANPMHTGYTKIILENFI